MNKLLLNLARKFQHMPQLRVCLETLTVINHECKKN